MRSGDSGEADRKEVIVKIDGEDEGGGGPSSSGGSGVGGSSGSRGSGASKIWRESSYDFWRDECETERKSGPRFQFQQPLATEDPPSKLIGQFLHKQKALGDFSLDMDMEMEELRNERKKPPTPESTMHPKMSSMEMKLSFQHLTTGAAEMSSESVRRSYMDKDVSDEDDIRQVSCDNPDGEVLRCTSNMEFQRKSSLLRNKTKSRLADGPEYVMKSGLLPKTRLFPKSGVFKSGLLGISEEEEEDPFVVDDLPEEFKGSNFSVWTILQWLILILLVVLLVCSLTIHPFKGRIVWKLRLWKWEVMVLVLICGRLVSGWGIRLVVFFIERNFLLRKRVLYFVYGLRKAVQNCLWLGLVLIAWNIMFDRKVKRETKSNALKYVTKTLVCLLVGVMIWLLKSLMVKVLASSFHVSTFFDRIQESLFNQYVIETLSGRPSLEIEHHKDEEQSILAELRSFRMQELQCPLNSRQPPSRHRLNHENVSAWNMKRLMHMVRHESLATLDEQIHGSTHEDEPATQIKSEDDAKNCRKENISQCGQAKLQDIMRFMREDEALRTMSLFDQGASHSEKISKSALKNWVVNAFRERRALALTLNDTKTAVNKLHQMVNVVVFIIVLIISLLILGIATKQFMTYLSSQLLLVVFIFGNTCKNIFEAIIFVFVMHPFDVGDRCEIDGVEMVVEEMNILTTVFLRADNMKIVFPNSTLATRPIGNFYRSPDMGDAVEFLVHIATPAEKIAMIRQRILSYMERKKDHWAPSPMVIIKDLEGLNQLRMAVWMGHKINHQNMGERWTRRYLLIDEIVKILREVDIEYRMIPLDINVRSMPKPSPVTSTRLPPSWTASVVADKKLILFASIQVLERLQAPWLQCPSANHHCWRWGSWRIQSCS
ncbi:Mechanosensitive ion channel protein 6 [Vitis vinifera]|uniref:Mechanosensitive ion channel protein n=1 Tax=Vitis vinifera TaxID=29760 RepID=A0A438IIX9_VITVI|nr:Mechanosensitive ion channel protein 6 [Vitis vinifera]